MDEATVNRLRAHAVMRPVAIPDTEGEIQGALDRLNALLGLAGPDEHEPGPASPVVTDAARQAAARLATAVRAAEAASPAQPVAPDGRYELVPIIWAHAETADLAELGLVVQALGRAWASRSEDLAVDALEDLAETAGCKPEDLIAEAARLHGLLSLPWDDTVSALVDALPPGAGRIVLDRAAHGAYQQLVDRILGIWHAGDHLARYLYRGGS